MNRRSFARQMAASLPVVAGMASMSQGAQEQQKSAPASPPPGRGQMDGSPLGDPLPGQKWRVHDRTRPQPRKVTPGQPIPTQSASSDAIVLFDGKDLSQWNGGGRGGAVTPPRWKVEDGYVELVPGAGSLVTKASFGDIQMHAEWMTPTGAGASRVGQFRGNSGVILMGRYEVQVLSSYDNPTYPDGSAGAIYGLYPPMVNPCLPEGQWNSYDLVFEAPKFEGEKLVKPAFLTLFFNGLLVQHRVQLLGTTSHEPIAVYTPHAPELPLSLQGHAGPARFRNIWIRRLLGYDV
ncbi:MAG TPA: DUF1080 domain-containing protein [Bryobacteraceae bacterium]|jgi:hypothetical protein|nr:DUF1080 domain-containing protein [Bryobacteraceae bacterium]